MLSGSFQQVSSHPFFINLTRHGDVEDGGGTGGDCGGGDGVNDVDGGNGDDGGDCGKCVGLESRSGAEVVVEGAYSTGEEADEEEEEEEVMKDMKEGVDTKEATTVDSTANKHSGKKLIEAEVVQTGKVGFFELSAFSPPTCLLIFPSRHVPIHPPAYLLTHLLTHPPTFSSQTKLSEVSVNARIIIVFVLYCVNSNYNTIQYKHGYY